MRAMADFTLKRSYQRKRLLITICLLAVGCGKSSESPELSVTFIKPLETHAQDGQNLLSFDVYAEKGILHAAFAVATSEPNHPTIAYLHSEDGGAHWSAPSAINTSLNDSLESRLGNDIQLAAADGHLAVVWQTTGEIPGMGPLLTMTSNDGGLNWQPGSNPTGSDTDQSHPDLAADPQGHFHLVWLDDRDENGYQGLRYARSGDAGQHWQLAQTLDESSCSCCWNRLLITPDGQINALYRDMEPRDMALAQSNDAGQHWQRLSTVGEFNWTFNGCPHNGGGLSWGGQQTLHSVVWTGADNKVGLYHLKSQDKGHSWSAPQAIGRQSSAFHSDIAAFDEQHLLVIWDAQGADGSTVFIAVSHDNGDHWQAARQLSTPGSSAAFPRLVATRDGWLALWTEQTPGANKQWRSALLKKP